MIRLGHCDWNLVLHCNFSCQNCSHLSPLMKPWSMSVEEIERDLMALKSFLTLAHWNLVGGETLLAKNIVEVMRLLKRVRMDDSTVVITNGSLLPRMSEDFWKELEYLSISVYPKLDPKCIELAEAKSKEYGFGLGKTIVTDFHRQFKPIPDDGVKSFETCHWRKGHCDTIHCGHFFRCAQSTFFPHTLQGLPEHIDGLPLEGITEEKFQAFLDRTEPFNACRICMANEMRSKPWAEAKNRGEWLKESTV